MEFRNMFQNIFGNQKQNNNVGQYVQFQPLNSYENFFSPAQQNYDNEIVRACIDCIAKHTAKLSIKHVINDDVKHDKLHTLLNNRPNEYMNTYDFIYKIVNQLYTYSNAFIYIQLDKDYNIIGFYPLEFNNVELKEYNNNLFLKFNFQNNNVTVPYTQIIHIRRFFNKHDLLGSQIQLNNLINTYNTAIQSIESEVKNSHKITGILKLTGIIKNEDKTNFLQVFHEKLTNKQGTAILDSTSDYQQLKNDVKSTDVEKMEFLRTEIYRCFGLSENIINSCYSTDEYQAFYQSIIEPLAIQLTQEFTTKVFTQNEQNRGHEILFTTNKLNYVSLQEKTNLAQTLMQAGILSVNEIRNMFGFDDIEGGEFRQISLNYVKDTDQSNYQIGVNGEVEK